MSAQELSGSTALVTGASRGFGRGVAIALAGAGANVVGVARDRAALEEVRALIGDGFTPVAADAADPVVAGKLIDAYRPSVLVLAAGAAPLSRPLRSGACGPVRSRLPRAGEFRRARGSIPVSLPKEEE